MRVDVYVFTKRFTLVDLERMHPIDNHLIRARHIESVYDVLRYIGSLDLEELEKAGLSNIVDKLKRAREVIVYDNNAIKVVEDVLKVRIPSNTAYIVLRLV